MYKITNTTKKEGHHVGPHKNGWYITLNDNNFVGPGKNAIVDNMTKGILDLQMDGLLKVEDIGNNMPVAAPKDPKKPVINAPSVEKAVIDEAEYLDGEPNFVVRATSQNAEETFEDAPVVTADSLSKGNRKGRK